MGHKNTLSFNKKLNVFFKLLEVNRFGVFMWSFCVQVSIFGSCMGDRVKINYSAHVQCKIIVWLNGVILVICGEEWQSIT